MPLHPEAEAERRRRATARVAPLYTLTLEEARAADLAAIQAGSGVPEPVGAVFSLLFSLPSVILLLLARRFLVAGYLAAGFRGR